MQSVNDLCPEYIRLALHYDVASGVFLWKHRPDKSNALNARQAGTVAGFLKSDGYWIIRINGRNYLAHRLAWVIVKGEWPLHDIDHRDCVKSNNKWENLRKATPSQNVMNSSPPIDNTSGFKGVCWDKKRGVWIAYIRKDGRRIHLGSFATLELAKEARQKSELTLFGEFSRAS